VLALSETTTSFAPVAGAIKYHNVTYLSVGHWIPPVICVIDMPLYVTPVMFEEAATASRTPTKRILLDPVHV